MQFRKPMCGADKQKKTKKKKEVSRLKKGEVSEEVPDDRGQRTR
jgi:hypothetical protein